MNFMVPELMAMLGRGWRQAPVAVLMPLLLASCNVTKYLAPGQELLTDQEIDIADPRNVEDRADMTYALGTIARPKPNTNFFLFWPREYFYLDNNKPKDTTAIDRFLRNTIGQPPAIYSDSLARRSVAAMRDYLLYDGYFNAEVYHEPDRRGRRKVNVIYHVTAGRRYLVDSLVYTSPDARMDSLLQTARPGSLLTPGEPLNLNDFDEERARISQLLRNNGYAFFSGNYIDQLEVDTSRREGYADVFFNILPPQQEAQYQPLRVGSITVLTDYNPLDTNETRSGRDTLLGGVRLVAGGPRFGVRPEILREAIALTPGGLYSRRDWERTNLALNELGIYRFVRINQQVDSLDDTVLNYTIQLSPSNRMSFGVDLDLNYTNRNGTAGAGNLLGLGIEPSFQNRNVFGGAELFTTSLRGGVEVNPSPSDNNPFFNTVDLAADVSIALPRFKDLGLYRLLNRIPAPYRGNIIGDGTLAGLRDRASTRFSVGYEYLLIRQLFAYTVFNTRLGYDYRSSPTTTYRINHFAVDVLNPTIEPAFQTVLDRNQRLARSFGQQYFFSLFFRSLEFNRVGRPDRRGRSVSFSTNVEVAGAEILGLNKLLDVFRDSTTDLRPTRNAEFAKYVRLQNSLRYNKLISPQTSFSARLAFEIGRPFGVGGDDELPYVKQFFAGGANSMRAWAPRGLGPGGHVDTLSLNTDNNLSLYQAGDLRLELNAEYRFPLFSLLRGALFADAGNVWLLEEDKQRPGAKFRFREALGPNILAQPFYRQLAINGGLGFRVDLSYFIFRLDFAIPLRYNYPHTGSGVPRTRDAFTRFPERDYWIRDFRFRNVRPQLGLGYPF